MFAWISKLKQRGGNHQEGDMSDHKFKIGQRVNYTSGPLGTVKGSIFTITNSNIASKAPPSRMSESQKKASSTGRHDLILIEQP